MVTANDLTDDKVRRLDGIVEAAFGPGLNW